MNLEDILNTTSIPLPDNGLSPLTLQCQTDLVDCCNSPRTQRGDWYYPNGTVIDFDAVGGTLNFRRNRGPNGPYGPGGQMVYGVVRLWRIGIPPERGSFRCEIPSAADQTVNQILYVHIRELKPDIYYQASVYYISFPSTFSEHWSSDCHSIW